MKKQMGIVAATIVLAAAVSSWAGSACRAKAAETPIQGCGHQGVSLPSSLETRTQSVCPVMGAPVSKSHYVEHNGKRVYFCCGACVSAFQKDPEKYLKKLAEDGVQLEDVSTAD